MLPIAPPSWTNAQLKKLGKCIRDDTDIPASLPRYNDVMGFYNDLAVHTQDRIEKLDWDSLLEGRPFEVTSRPKTIDTLKQKLQREPSTQLPSIQDVAGVRFEAEMTLDEQDAVVHAIAGAFDHLPDRCVRDLRTAPHSGYRAVHLWLRLPERVEVQVRTHLQGAWANLYEVAADVFGREIRYGGLPDHDAATELVEGLRAMSLETVAPLENILNEIALTRLSRSDAPLKLGNRQSRRQKKKVLGSIAATDARFLPSEARARNLETSLQQQMLDLTETLAEMRVGERS